MRQLYLLLISWAFLVPVLRGQSIIEATLEAEISQDSLTTLFSFQATNDILVYRVLYRTIGTDMRPDTASGLVVLPVASENRGLIAYQHGTTDGPDDVPSNLNQEAQIAYVFGGQGYLVSAADYLGLGSSRGFHPYVHAATEASAGLDLMLAAKDLAADLGFETVQNIFVTGYSQGGHAAMALAQAIQERVTDDLWITAAAPMSGPYSISGVMRDLSLFGDENYFYPSYLAYIMLGYQEVYGDIYSSIDSVLQPPFIDMVRSFQNGEIGLFSLNEEMVSTMLIEYQSLRPQLLLRPSYRTAVETDSLHPLNVALRENDTYKWVPDFPMRMFYCEGDDQVPFANSIVAEEYMLKEGAEDVDAINLVTNADHGACVLPAVLSTLAFFNTFETTTPTQDLSPGKELAAYPNPSTGLINIKTIEEKDILELVSIDGVPVKSIDVYGPEVQLDLRDIPAGIYFLRSQRDPGRNAKILIQNP